jgi:putative PEP-CTERM system TPR-repeat lipoprotein
MKLQTNRPSSCRGTLAFLLVLVGVVATGCDSFRSDAERVEAAKHALAAGDYRAASLELRRVLDSSPDNAEARLAVAELSLAMGDARTAEKDLERALAAGLPPERAAVPMGRVMLATDRAAALLQQLNDGTLPAAEPDRSVLKGDALTALGELAAAENTFRAVLEKSPANLHATVGLALVTAAQDRQSEALALLAAFLEANPDAAEAWLLQGDILSRETRFSGAEAAYRHATSDKARGLSLPQQVSALSGLAEAQLIRGAPADARATLERMRGVARDAAATHLIAARLALATQDYGTAVAELRPLVVELPNLAAARFLLGAALLAQGNLEQAESHLSRLVQLAPDNVEGRKLLAKARLRLQRYDGAMEVLTPAMRSDTTDAELSSLFSEAMLQVGERGRAVDVLEQASEKNPDDVGLKLDLASAYIAAGRSAEAVDLLRSLPEVTGDPRRESLLVAALEAAKGPAEAGREVQRLVAAHPGDINILSLAASHAMTQSDFGDARRYLEQALEIAPQDPRLLEMLAQAEIRAGNIDSAEAAWKRLLDIPGSRTKARLGLVEIASLRGRPADARQGLEQIRREDPEAIGPRLALARLMLSASEATQAATVLSEAVAISPQDALVRLQVGRLLADFGRYDEAMRQVQQAVELDPDSAEAWLEVARMQSALDRSGPARQSIEKAVALDGNSIEAVGMLALMDLRANRSDAALRGARELSARRPGDPRAAVLEGDVYMALGQAREATRSYKRAYSLRPDLQIAAKQSAAMRAAQLTNPEAPLARWVAEEPHDDRARMLLAQAYQADGRRQPAIEQYERLATNPAVGFSVFNNLAWLYYEVGDDRAESTARRALDLASDNPAVMDTYGWILVEKGQVAEGRDLLAVAAQRAPGEPDIAYHYAAALARSGDERQAAEVLAGLLRSNASFSTRAEAERLQRQLASVDGNAAN